MTPLLSIIVPTYNMASLVAGCLDSVTGCRRSDLIQVLAVNDGSRDSSLEILRDAERRHPGCVTVIDKPNGNYGSAVNAGLSAARGRFVRVLDADDRYDTLELDRYLDYLAILPECDMVVGPYAECGRHGRRTVGFAPYSRNPYGYGTVYPSSRIFADGRIPFFAMHSVAYRTELLKELGYRQTEGLSYTDQEWVFMPLFHVTTIAFYPRPIYLYNIAREGQTMDPEVQMRGIGQMTAVTVSMARYYSANQGLCDETGRKFLLSILERRLKFIYRKYLLEMGEGQFAASGFGTIDASLKDECLKCGISDLAVLPNPWMGIDLLGHWNACHRRHSRLTLWLLRTMNYVMNLAYRLVY